MADRPLIERKARLAALLSTAARRVAAVRGATLESGGAGNTYPVMLRRLTHVLIAVVIVLATMMPVSVHAMPMPSAANGMATHQPCPSCPQNSQSGHMNPGTMPSCQILACAGPLAMLPTPVLAHGQAFFRVAYVKAAAARWTDARPAPDPFPPRPIVLL